MEHSTTDELYIVVHHVPGNIPACSLPRIRIDHFIALDGNVMKFLSQFTVQFRRRSTNLTRRKSFRGFTYNCKSFRVYFEKYALNLLQDVLVNGFYLLVQRLARIVVFGCGDLLVQGSFL